ncbi:helix-turn-helix domain-containing protein [Roseovarius nitratireducens]|uniref:helix-turn-helix domain-containing protein n=1 Tax=Roseovarius nitratireducens TaxID=2044597 RepID=UPI000CE19C4F|nr:helix-turn-helix transcriptional regulator [Roseovarius nitratireducens]
MRLRIKEARVAAGMKQREVAKILGISQPYFAQIERGERRLNTELQQQLADVLGVKPPELVDFDAPTPEDEQFLLDVFRTLSPDRRAGWLDMARAATHRPRGGGERN